MKSNNVREGKSLTLFIKLYGYVYSYVLLVLNLSSICPLVPICDLSCQFSCSPYLPVFSWAFPKWNQLSLLISCFFLLLSSAHLICTDCLMPAWLVYDFTKIKTQLLSDDLLNLPAISNELSEMRKEDLQYSYARPFFLWLLPAAVTQTSPAPFALLNSKREVSKLLILLVFETIIVPWNNHHVFIILCVFISTLASLMPEE